MTAAHVLRSAITEVYQPMHRLVAASITAAAAVPALAYALAGRWPEALLCALVGVGWFGGQRRGLGWPGSIALLLLVLAAGYGVLSGLAAGWGLTGVVAALLAWDLDAFALRLAAGRAVDEAGLWRAHLRRLAPVVGSGLALGAAALAVRLDLDFGWVLLLGLVAAVALGRAVRALRSAEA